MKNSNIVFSTDPIKNQKCDRCGRLVTQCECRTEEEYDLKRLTPHLSLSKAGRKGKTVTVIDRLPKNEEFLKDYTKKLKTQCGSGGTYKMTPLGGVIEIQGDKRDAIKKIFTKDGIRFKG